MEKNIIVDISTRHHMNIVLNIYQCGNMNYSSCNVWGPSSLDYYMLCVVNSGSGTLTVEKDSYPLSAGKCFAVFPLKKTSFVASDGGVLNLTWVSFSGYLVDAYLKRAKITDVTPLFEDSEDGIVKCELNRLVEQSRQMPNRYCKMISTLYSIFANILDIAAPRLTHATHTPEYYAIKALDYIDIHYAEDISVEYLAAYLGISRKRLLEVFKKCVNLSPRSYIINFRIERACKLLLDKTMTVDQVSQSVGYSMQFYFSKEFKRIVGMTPTEYRKGIIKDPNAEHKSIIHDIVKL